MTAATGGDHPDDAVVESVRQNAQVLISARFHGSPELSRLIDEAFADHPCDLLVEVLVAFIDVHTSRANPRVAKAGAVLRFVVDHLAGALTSMAAERGEEVHAYLRQLQMLIEEESDGYDDGALVLVTTALMSEGESSALDQAIEVASSAPGRVCSALLDLWFVAALCAVEDSRESTVMPLLDTAVEVIRHLAAYTRCPPEKTLIAYWTWFCEPEEPPAQPTSPES